LQIGVFCWGFWHLPIIIDFFFFFFVFFNSFFVVVCQLVALDVVSFEKLNWTGTFEQGYSLFTPLTHKLKLERIQWCDVDPEFKNVPEKICVFDCEDESLHKVCDFSRS